MEENNQGMVVSDFGGLMGGNQSNRKIYTTITDQKKLFNLETSCDYKINDCKGEIIVVKDVVIKINEKPLKEPILDVETGEIKKQTEKTMVCILIDNEENSYVTASKIFTIQMIRYIQMFGLESIENGLNIKIIEKTVKNSPNKALGFEIV